MGFIMTIADRADALAQDFDLLGDWEERFAYIIDLGRGLAPLAPEELCEANRVRGCSSQVWLACSPSTVTPGGLTFRGASDAIIVAGLTALLIGLYSDGAPDEILAFDAEAFFRKIGVAEALTPQRSNGLKSMLARIRAEAQALA
jgi:cysteine desulfuration protein SufE